MSDSGKLIVLEGTDGSGKSTQFALLRERLERAGYEVETFDFPRYDKPSSYFVREYLQGAYGTVSEVGPYTASLFYALDRFQAASEIRRALEQGKIVLSNRFTASNMAHQGAKFSHAEERRGFFIWLDNLEFLLLKIPRPDINFVLHVPADVAQQMVDQKKPRSYTNKKRDLHEADLAHLQKSAQTYEDLCSLFPQDFQRIDCMRNNKLLPIEDVHKIVWEKVTTILPKPPKSRKKRAAADTPTPAAQAAMPPETITEKLSFYTQLELIRRGISCQPVSVDFTKKDEPGRYPFMVPDTLRDEAKNQYESTMDSLFELYSELHFRLTEYLKKNSKVPVVKQDSVWEQSIQTVVTDTLYPVLPLSALRPYHINTGALANAQLHPLARHELEEHVPNRAILANVGVAQLAPKLLKETYSTVQAPVTLTHISPRNELDIVPDILYPFSGMALQEIESAVATWNYDQKAAVLIAYLTDPTRDRSALEKVRYQFDLVSDVAAISALGNVTITWQALTPRHGYDMPKLIEDAELSELYERCFDMSLELHSTLQATGYTDEAQYAVLLGHKARWQLSMGGYEALELYNLLKFKRNHGPHKSVFARIHETIAERHPILSTL